MNTIIRLSAMCLALLVALAPEASAEPALTGTIEVGSPQNGGTNPNGLGRQSWGKSNSPASTLGLDFMVGSAAGITVRSLGIWDDNGDGLLVPHVLTLWNIDDINSPILLASVATAPGGGDLDPTGWYRYFDIAPVVLAAGTEFTVAAYYPSFPGAVVDSNGNSGAPIHDLEPTPIVNDLGGSIISIGTARFFYDGNSFPSTADWMGPSNRYHAASFEYTPNPEPGTMLLIGGAMTAAGIVRRRRRRAKQIA